MIHTLGTILKTIFKWIIFLLVVVIILRLATLFVPWLGQNSIKGEISDLNGTSTESTKTGFKFPTPGSWSIMGTGTANIAKPKINPSVPDSYYNNGGTYQSPAVPN